MFRRMATIAGALLILAACSSTPSTRTVSCASRDGAFTNCEQIGSSAVSLSQQVSDIPCIENVSWGVRDGRLWVDQGCRAEFLVGGRARAASPIGTSAGLGGTPVVCESRDGKLTRCPANTYGGVRLARQISDTTCIYDRTWGWDTQGVWVNEGCRAEFIAGTAGTVSSRTIVCESQGGRNHCPADTRLGLDLVRQLSDSPCVRNRTWGEDGNGIWVDQGCRAEFAVRAP